MPLSLDRLELWTDVEPAQGRRVALIAEPLALTERVTLEGEDTLSLRLHQDDPALVTLDTPAGQTNAEPQAVIRAILRDGSLFERRILRITEQDEEGQRLVDIEARGILHDLSYTGLVRRVVSSGVVSHDFEAANLTPTRHLELYILPALAEAGQWWWQLGTVEADEPVTVRYTHDSPLAALRKVAAAGSRALELAARFDRAAMCYRLDLLQRVGANAAPVRIHSSLNLRTLAVARSAEDLVNRVYAFGAGDETTGDGTLAPNAWLVTARRAETGTGVRYWFTLTDPAGGSGPVGFDGQYGPRLDGSRYRLRATGSSGTSTEWAILDSRAVSQEILCLKVGTYDPVDGRCYSILTPEAALTYVEDAASVTAYGARVGSVEMPETPAHWNHLRNPLGRVVDPANPTGLPLYWQARKGYSPYIPTCTVAAQTDPRYWRSGGRSIFVSFTQDGTHLRMPGYVDSLAGGGLTGGLSFYADVWVITGAITVLLYLTFASGGDVSIPNDTMPDWEAAYARCSSTSRNQWERVGWAGAYNLDTVRPLSCALSVWPNSDPCSVYIDGGQVTVSSDQRPLVEGSGSNRLIVAANERLLRYRTPALGVDVDALDLTSVDDKQFPYNNYALGGSVEVTNPALGQTLTTRVTGWSRDWLRPEALRLDISQARGDITRVLASRSPGSPALVAR
jgi:hypothetical protein